MEVKWKTCWRVALTGFVLWLLIHYWDSFAHVMGLAVSAAVPLLIGCVIAYVVNILMTFYETHLFGERVGSKAKKAARPVCMLLAFCSIVLIIYIIVRAIVPELVQCVQILLKDVPKALQDLMQWAEEEFAISQWFGQSEALQDGGSMDMQEMLKKIVSVLLTGLGGALQTTVGVVSSLFSGVTTFILALIFAIYLLAGKEKLHGQCETLLGHYLPEKVNHKVHYVLGVLNQSFHSFIVGQCVEAVIIGVLCMIGMWILRIPYAAMVGCLIGFTALIPIAGAYIGAIVGTFLIFTVSPFKAVVFLIFLVILQQVESNLIYPRVVGTAIGLPGIWVLAAVVIGGGTLGIAGMLLGVPLASTVYRLLYQDVHKGDGSETEPDAVKHALRN